MDPFKREKEMLASGIRKAAFASVALVIAAVAGLYLSGAITLMLLKLDAPLKWNTWLEYWQALSLPDVAPYAKTIRIGGLVGFGLPLLLWLLLLVPLFKSRRPSTHGDARFATRSDLARLGLLKDDPQGIIVGKSGRRFLRMSGTRHALLAAPTRSGKGVGFVMPNLLDFRGSVVVLDIKQESFDISSGWRQQLGPVYLFNPFADDLRTHAWNPFDYVRTARTFRTSDLQAIADCLYKESAGQDPFWLNMARSTFVAMAGYLFDHHQYQQTQERPGQSALPTLGAIYRLLSGDGDDLKQLLRDLANKPFVHADTRLGFANITGLADETFTSVIAVTQAPLLILANPIVDAATSRSDFNLGDLRRRVQSIYVGISPSKLGEARGLLNLFFEQAIKANGSVLPEQDPTLRHHCLFLLDEFTALGKVDIIIQAVGWLAGYGVRIACVIQSLSQLESVYGAEAARSMVTNLACQIIYTPREQRDAEEYSKMLGDTTVRRRQHSRGQGGGSYTELEERRALMLPQELKAMSPEQEIVLIEGTPHPTRCSKIRYYQDRYFIPRLKHARATVPVLDMSGEGQAATDVESASTSSIPPGVDPRTLYVPPALQDHYDRYRPYLPPTEQGTLITVHKLSTPDRLYDLCLRRMMEVANERTVRELGRLPHGGLPIVPKKKAPHPPWRRRAIPLPTLTPEQEAMMLKQMMMASTLAAAGAVTGCGSQTPDFKRNPHPVEQYEITVTVHDAPGPLIATQGGPMYQAFDCAYAVNRLAGSWGQPEASHNIGYRKIDATTYVGRFFLDGMLDEDYDGLGGSNPCHWQFTGVDILLRATGADGETKFGAWLPRNDVLAEKPVTLYFNKMRYPSNDNIPNYPHGGRPPERYGPGVHDSDLFSVTLVARKVQP